MTITWLVNRQKGLARTCVLALLVPRALLTGCAASPSMLAPAGPVANQIATLTWIVFAIATVVFIILLALLVTAIVRSYRKVEPKPLFQNGTRSFLDSRASIAMQFAEQTIPALAVPI